MTSKELAKHQLKHPKDARQERHSANTALRKEIQEAALTHLAEASSVLAGVKIAPPLEGEVLDLFSVGADS
jgi:hypothetical protein